MKNLPLISVVMATFNGATYLEAQLDSIYSQTYTNIEVIVCDDLSTDSTVEVLENYKQRHGLRYFINEEKLGVKGNFEKAITHANGEYIALSDQDDVWLPEKLAHSLQELIRIEQETPAKPVVVFSDLTVVDEDLNLISSSYWQFMQLNPQNTLLNRILVENVVTGCTLLMNRLTVTFALPIPQEALMHDVWFLLIASCLGKVSYIPEKTVLYRQHRHNVVGARQKNLLQKVISGYQKIKENKFALLQPEIEQAKSFYMRFNRELVNSTDNKTIMEVFIRLKSHSFFPRKYFILKYAFYGSTLKKALNVLLRA